MKSNHSYIAWGLIVLGFLSAFFSTTSLLDKNGLNADNNPFALKRSAYGRLLARLSETTVDRVWHLGVEEIVPHYMSGDTHGESAPASTPETKDEVEKKVVRKPPIEEAKGWIQKRVISQYTRTNPYGMSEKHRLNINLDIADMLKRSYDLDPTHYGAYNSYNLFITHQTYGGSTKGRAIARQLAEETIELVKEEDEDPEAYITAASALMNLFILKTEDARNNQTALDLSVLKEFRDETAFLLGRFEELQERAEAAGNWDYLSFERQVEIAQRHRFTKKTSSQFDAMIARAESRSMSPSPTEAEVAETID